MSLLRFSFTLQNNPPRTVHAVLKETLRIFPSAPLIARTSIDEPLVLPTTTKLHLPPKTQIMMSSLLTHKRPDLWGPDAEVFRPERWLDPTLLDKVASTPFMYSPFYGGPRVVRFVVFLRIFLCAKCGVGRSSVWDGNSRSMRRHILSCASCSASAPSLSHRSICLLVRSLLHIGRACLADRAWRRYIRRST